MLSANDWKAVAGAMGRMEETALEREQGPHKVRVSTVPAGQGWTAAMLVRVERWRPWWYETRYFESVEEAGRNAENMGLSVLAMGGSAARPLSGGKSGV